MRVAAVVLAAGASKRLGRPKQSIVFRGETLLTRAVRIACEVADEVVLVTAPAISLPETFGVRIVMNTRAEEGIGSSIRAGISPIADDARLLLLLADQPLVTADHLRALIACDAPIAASGYAGIAGVPAVFAPSFRPDLLALRGDRGARAVIEANRGQCTVVPFEDAAADIDDEGDVGRLLNAEHGARNAER